MMNIVDQYTSEEAVNDDEGVVAIEYVVVASAIVFALGAIWVAFGDNLNTKLEAVINSIRGA